MTYVCMCGIFSTENLSDLQNDDRDVLLYSHNTNVLERQIQYAEGKRKGPTLKTNKKIRGKDKTKTRTKRNSVTSLNCKEHLGMVRGT